MPVAPRNLKQIAVTKRHEGKYDAVIAGPAERTMNLSIRNLIKLGILRNDLDYHLFRALMVIICVFFGYQKWFDYEAQAVVATVFVCRESYRQSMIAALSRTAATSLSFVLCLGYLLLLAFSSWGMTILIAIGALILILIDRPDDVITTSITTAVVMVVAGISPLRAWRQPILRLFDTLIGIAVGIAAAWIARGLHNLGHLGEKHTFDGQIQWKITKETL